MRFSRVVGVLSVFFSVAGIFFITETVVLLQHNGTIAQSVDLQTALCAHMIVCAFQSSCITCILWALRRNSIRAERVNRLSPFLVSMNP